jgi:hypothetical protein
MLHDFEESSELKRRFAEVGATVLMGGRIGEAIEFYYLDTEPSLQIILESGSGHAIDLVPDDVYPWRAERVLGANVVLGGSALSTFGNLSEIDRAVGLGGDQAERRPVRRVAA